MEFSEYQRLALQYDKTGGDPTKSLMVTLLGLAGETGSLLSEYKKWLREGDAYKPFSHQAAEELGDILWYLANLASKLNQDLGEIAEENLAKIEDRGPAFNRSESGLFSTHLHPFDASFPPAEQLPTEIRIDFIEDIDATEARLRLRYKGEFVGDPLTDNSHINDGYRYHDVFHIGCAILLGWSPVMRRILKCKRKSASNIDVVEDGARALVTEEGVSAVIFSHARDYSLFERTTSVDYELLRTVKSMTTPFEVRTRSLADWEKMILLTFKAWRNLIQYHGGTVIGDAKTGILEFEPPSW
jgi:NTP pyrophosphatase (non-canonical NTP hydrolase)